mmetsp:Transcript_61089/g.139712  ORF Transcript_61089/g.139712 Transcript_61089/m.139712 type:complete len:392 (+) Transcript_61089:40-1215(+)
MWKSLDGVGARSGELRLNVAARALSAQRRVLPAVHAPHRTPVELEPVFPANRARRRRPRQPRMPLHPHLPPRTPRALLGEPRAPRHPLRHALAHGGERLPLLAHHAQHRASLLVREHRVGLLVREHGMLLFVGEHRVLARSKDRCLLRRKDRHALRAKHCPLRGLENWHGLRRKDRSLRARRGLEHWHVLGAAASDVAVLPRPPLGVRRNLPRCRIREVAPRPDLRRVGVAAVVHREGRVGREVGDVGGGDALGGRVGPRHAQRSRHRCGLLPGVVGLVHVEVRASRVRARHLPRGALSSDHLARGELQRVVGNGLGGLGPEERLVVVFRDRLVGEGVEVAERVEHLPALARGKDIVQEALLALYVHVVYDVCHRLRQLLRKHHWLNHRCP